MAKTGIVASTRAYERWLRDALDNDIVAADLKKKHATMRKSAFAFLRATYWRWAETILEVCSDLGDAPTALAVGDIHIENFGTWRDVEGRLVWGVNDYDEAAKMPYILDLVRLGASARLADSRGNSTEAISAALRAGYRAGLADPNPTVLDAGHHWLRQCVEVPEDERSKFWGKFDPARQVAKAGRHGRRPPRRFVRALEAARPDRELALQYWPRTAGAGSLGRPRWVGYGDWRGAPVIREAKAIVPSGWVRVHGGGRRLRCEQIATGRFRSPDPWYRLEGAILVRRLSPNNRKLEVGEVESQSLLLQPEILKLMGKELAAIHLGSGDRRDAIVADFAACSRRSLARAIEAAADFVEGEQRTWKRSAA